MMVSGINLVARFVPELYAAFGQTIAVPVNRGAGIVTPHFNQILLQVACGICRYGANELPLVDHGAVFLLVAGVHGRQVVANAGTGRESVDADHLGPLFCRSGNGKHTAGTAADHENFRLDRIDNVFFRYFGRLAEPVAVIGRFGLGDDFNGNFTFGLCDALGGRLVNGLRSDARSGNGVNVGRLSLQKRLPELLCSGLADVGRLVRDVENNIRDLV